MKFDTDKACNLCGAHDETVVSNIDRDGNPLKTVICNQCGLVYTNPRPNDEQINAFYDDEYRLNYKNTYTPKIKYVFRAGNAAIERYQRYLKNTLSKDDELLDVGAGGGEFLYLLKSLGFNAEGIEPNKGYAEHAANQYGITILGARLGKAIETNKQYSFITCYHVLEHMVDPSAALQQMVDLCKKDGRILIEVPNIEATCQHPNNKFHLAHLYNFNLTTLSALGEKLGLTVESTFKTPDNGNIIVIFRNTGIKKQDIQNKMNAETIKKMLSSHTKLKHLLSPYPYARLARKLPQAILERNITKKYKGQKTLLDALYKAL